MTSTHLVGAWQRKCRAALARDTGRRRFRMIFYSGRLKASIKFIIWPVARHGYFAARLDSGRAVIAAFDANHQSVEFFPTVSAAGAALPSRMQGVLS
jgi:hypothetical protein